MNRSTSLTSVPGVSVASFTSPISDTSVTFIFCAETCFVSG